MESRLKKSLNAGGRDSRASQDITRQPPEEKFMNSQERPTRKMWSEEWTQSALPKVPEIPGWHVCWLSTTNGYDTIDKRMRLGYVPVPREEVPVFYEQHKVKSAEITGFVTCNEMVLYKIPMDVYQDVMLHMHHELPNEEAEKIKVQVEQLQGAQDSNGRHLTDIEGDGLRQLSRKNVPDPIFHG